MITQTDTLLDDLDVDLFVEDLQSEELPQTDSLISTVGSFATGACASCPASSASSASCIGSASG